MKLTPWMLTMAAFGIIALLAVGFIFKKLMASPVAEVKPPEPRVLPMAISAIEPGTVITAAHVGNGRASASQELKKDTFTSREGVIGRIAKVRIEAAVPLEGNMFYSIGDHPGLAVAPGKQAVTVNVSETSAVLLQKLKSDQRVDVLLTVTGTGTGGGDRIQNTGSRSQGSSLYTSLDDSMTVTLFKGVKVLAVHRGGSAAALVQSSTESKVTLELDEDEARIVSLAQRKGEIDLVYTSLTEPSAGIDIEAEEANRITVREILGIEREKEKEKPFRTEHYRGGGRTSSYFEDGERLDGYGGSGDGGGGAFGGSQIQNTGGGQDWSTDAKPANRQQNVAQKPVAAGS